MAKMTGRVAAFFDAASVILAEGTDVTDAGVESPIFPIALNKALWQNPPEALHAVFGIFVRVTAATGAVTVDVKAATGEVVQTFVASRTGDFVIPVDVNSFLASAPVGTTAAKIEVSAAATKVAEVFAFLTPINNYG